MSFCSRSLGQVARVEDGSLGSGFLRPKMEESSCPILVQIEEVMNGPPEEASRVTPFTELVPYYPLREFFLETKSDAEWDNADARRRLGFPHRLRPTRSYRGRLRGPGNRSSAGDRTRLEGQQPEGSSYRFACRREAGGSYGFSPAGARCRGHCFDL